MSPVTVAAVHESGHSVARVRLGLPLYVARLDSSGGGEVLAVQGARGIRLADAPGEAVRRLVEGIPETVRRTCVALLAGPVAEVLFLHGTGTEPALQELLDCSREDSGNLLSLMRARCSGEESQEKMFTREVNVTTRLVRRWWCDILAVAEVLEYRRVLTGDEISKIVKGAV
ncbi:hypothetical protein [Aminiphilus sp.]|jgi:hypothetical protein|uniref:hypothetical protein n=1 Tax=Aminiphilus sp. TaxID=1872488 RepID=UPI0004925C82|nr:hypothetical protein [Aminiphilus sp.]